MYCVFSTENVARILQTQRTLDISQKCTDAFQYTQQQPHKTQLVITILNLMHLPFHEEQNFPKEQIVEKTVPLFTSQELQDLAWQDQLAIAKALHNDEYDGYTDEIITIAGWSGLVPGRAVIDNMLVAANWAKKKGGLIGHSHISYQEWETFWEEYCAADGALSQTEQSTEQEQQDFWTFLNEKQDLSTTDEDHTFNLQIGGNSGRRCWFLSVLYFLVGEAQFMNKLKSKQAAPNNYGERLLYKILQNLKISIMEQNIDALQQITEFVEVLLQGHFCYWMDFGSVETAFRILTRMCPNLFETEFAVKLKIWSKCRHHPNIKGSEREVTALRLSFFSDIDWNENDGIVQVYNNAEHNCYQVNDNDFQLCLTVCKHRFYQEISDADRSFIVYFEHGVPLQLWNSITQRREIFFGDQCKQVGGAIFRLHQSHFVAAYLLINPNNNPSLDPNVWIRFETLEKKIMKFTQANHQNCHFIFVHPPETSCWCGWYNDFYQLMIQCPLCEKWAHKTCAIIDQHEQEWNGNNCQNCI